MNLIVGLIDRRFTIKGALDILVNQGKCPDGYKKCQCLGCKFEVEVEGNQGTCLACHEQSSFAVGDVNVDNNQRTCLACHEQSSFADGDVNFHDNQGTCMACHEQSSFADGNDNDNQGTCFADDKQESSLSEEDDIVWSKARDSPTKQRDKSCSLCGCGCGGAPSPKASRLRAPVNSKGNLFINVNGSLQSWITDSNIMVYAPFPENLRCIITGPGECGKTVLLKNLFIPGIHFDRLYIIGPTGNQYNDLEYKDIVFIKDTKELPQPDKLKKDIKKLLIFDDVIAKEPINNEYFCRDRHKNCDMIYLKQNIFSADRQNVRENCNLFIFVEETGKTITAI